MSEEIISRIRAIIDSTALFRFSAEANAIGSLLDQIRATPPSPSTATTCAECNGTRRVAGPVGDPPSECEACLDQEPPSTASEVGELPPLLANVVHVTRRIRRCEGDVPAQVVLEHFAIEYARAALAAKTCESEKSAHQRYRADGNRVMRADGGLLAQTYLPAEATYIASALNAHIAAQPSTGEVDDENTAAANTLKISQKPLETRMNTSFHGGAEVDVEAERKQAEHAYTVSAFDYARDPVGSRDWTLFWSGYQAARRTQAEGARDAVLIHARNALDASYSKDVARDVERRNAIKAIDATIAATQSTEQPKGEGNA